MKIHTFITLTAVLWAVTSFGQSIERATLYREHGLLEDAKRDYIQILSSESHQDQKSEALYSLGLIALNQNRISVALESWTRLVNDYPTSQHSKMVQDRINELSQIVGDYQKESVDNAVAQSYLNHGDFWTREKDEIFIIESGPINAVRAAIKWYDKTINEFSKTTAARIAFEKKMKAILGWRKVSGIEKVLDEETVNKKDRETYIPLLVETFLAYQNEFPSSSNLQSFRYQIAQAYWRLDDYDNAQQWLNEIVEKGGGVDSFYVDLANRKLETIKR